MVSLGNSILWADFQYVGFLESIVCTAELRRRSAPPWPGLSCPSKMNCIPTQNFLALAIAGDRHWKTLFFFLKKNKKFFIASNHSWNGQMQCELRVPRQDITWGLV